MEYGAQVNLSDINGNTSLMVSNSVAISNMLINAGADVNLVNEDGKTALMIQQGKELQNTDLVHLLMVGK